MEHEVSKIQKENIINYVTSRLGRYGVLKDNWTYEEETFHQNLSKHNLGIFERALSKCQLTVTLYKIQNANGNLEKTYNGRIRLEYVHHGGGMNGCELDFGIRVFPNGEVMETY